MADLMHEMRALADDLSDPARLGPDSNAKLQRLQEICSSHTRYADAVIAAVAQELRATEDAARREILERTIKSILFARGPSQEEKEQAPTLRRRFPTTLPLRKNIACPACGLPYSVTLPKQLNAWLQGQPEMKEVPIQCNNAGCGAMTIWVVPEGDADA